MGLREELSRRIERKEQEIAELELKVMEARAYLQGLQDTLKMIPRDAAETATVTLREGSDVARARDAIRKSGKPLHLVELLKAQGKPSDKRHKLALAGSLARYARTGMVFVRTAPNTYGLLELRHHEKTINQGIPVDFGVTEPAPEPPPEEDDIPF